ncbi:hypothetical protein M885DRAFT_517419 [Pelagophyceae sp. CCMP2097]|nr:hypothetical protein M885DRAFT_517419 [Pelagophyceae sp. CCMP2097]
MRVPAAPLETHTPLGNASRRVNLRSIKTPWAFTPANAAGPPKSPCAGPRPRPPGARDAAVARTVGAGAPRRRFEAPPEPACANGEANFDVAAAVEAAVAAADLDAAAAPSRGGRPGTAGNLQLRPMRDDGGVSDSDQKMAAMQTPPTRTTAVSPTFPTTAALTLKTGAIELGVKSWEMGSRI